MLRRNLKEGIIVVSFLSVFVFLGAYEILNNSITLDEPDHCFSGYYYWQTADFSMEPENPPLAKLFFTFPYTFIKPGLPAFSNPAYKVKDAYVLGQDFLYRRSEQGKRLLLISRLLVLVSSIPLGLLIFVWSRKLWGTAGGMISLVLFSLEPNLLAFSGLASPDFIAAFMVLLALYCLGRFLEFPSAGNFFLTALVLALAFAVKFSALTLIPVSLIVLAVWKLETRQNLLICRSSLYPGAFTRILDYAMTASLAGMIAFFVLWAIYGFETRTVAEILDPYLSAKGTSLEMAILKRSLPMQSVLLETAYHVKLPVASLVGGYLKVLVAAQSGGPVFLLGKIYPHGVWFYFPMIFLLKTSPIILVLLFIALVYLSRNKAIWRQHFIALFILLSFLYVFFLTSLNVRLNIGYRHLLPAVPPVLILCGAAGAVWRKSGTAVRVLFFLLLCLYALSSLIFAGNYLTYFNILGGNKHIAAAGDSNLDWGQYLLELKHWMKQNDVAKVYGKMFCPNSYQFYGIEFSELNSWSQFEKIRAEEKEFCVVISANYLQGTQDWDPQLQEVFSRTYQDQIIGNALYLFRITSQSQLLPQQPDGSVKD